MKETATGQRSMAIVSRDGTMITYQGVAYPLGKVRRNGTGATAAPDDPNATKRKRLQLAELE